MSISPERLQDYARYITSDEECLTEIARRMSVRYWAQFCAANNENGWQVRSQLASKQDLLNDFIRELRTILAENVDPNT